jgi:hypothetical protein
MFLAMALAFILLRLPYIIMYEIHDKRELIWKDPDVYITKVNFTQIFCQNRTMYTNRKVKKYYFQSIVLFRKISKSINQSINVYVIADCVHHVQGQ